MKKELPLYDAFGKVPNWGLLLLITFEQITQLQNRKNSLTFHLVKLLQ